MFRQKKKNTLTKKELLERFKFKSEQGIPLFTTPSGLSRSLVCLDLCNIESP